MADAETAADQPNLDHVPADARAAYEAESAARPGESHDHWTGRVRRLLAELLARHPVPDPTASPAPAPAAPVDETESR